MERFYLRLRGRDPDLVARISQLSKKYEECRAIVRRNHEKIQELMQQIKGMEDDFCEFKRYFVDYKKGSPDWRTKGEALAVFLDYLEEVIPLTDEEKKLISEAHESFRREKMHKKTGETVINKLFTQLGFHKKGKTPQPDAKPTAGS